MAASSRVREYRSPPRQFVGRLHQALLAADAEGIDWDDFLAVIAHNKEALRSAVNSAYANFVFNLTVDHDVSIEEAIERCRFNYLDQHYWGDYPSSPESGKERLRLKIIPLFFYQHLLEDLPLHDVDSKVIIADQRKQGMKPAGLRPLLALAQKYPNLQLYFPINALGETFEMSERRGHGYYTCVPSIRRSNWPLASKDKAWDRCLSMRRFDTKWWRDSEDYNRHEYFAVILP